MENEVNPTLYIARSSTRARSVCVCGQQHGAATDDLVIVQDGKQLCAACTNQVPEDVRALLSDLAALPAGTKIPVGVVINLPAAGNTRCGQLRRDACPEPVNLRRAEIIHAVPWRGGMSKPIIHCPKCNAREFPEVDAVLHQHCGSTAPAPAAPTPELEKSPVEVATERDQRHYASIVDGLTSGNPQWRGGRQLSPGQFAAEILQIIDERITAMLEGK